MSIVQPSQVGNTFGFTVWRGEPVIMQAPHAHNDIEVNVCSSELVYASGGRTVTLPKRTPCAFWGATPHQLIGASEHARFAFATIPLAQFMSWGVRETVGERLLGGEVLIGKERQDDPVDDFARWSEELADLSPSGHRAVALELEALLYRMTRGSWVHARESGDRGSHQLEQVSRMATFIAANATSDIHLADIARSIHLHESRASALFRAVMGTSVTSYLAQFRVAEAQRLLLTSELPSAVVAHKAGFQSLSAFHHTFRQVCGLTPTRWRKDHR